MTQTERAAYNAGIKAAINAAQIVAITIECAEDAGSFRKRVTAEALAAFAEAAEGLKLEPITVGSSDQGAIPEAAE